MAIPTKKGVKIRMMTTHVRSFTRGGGGGRMMLKPGGGGAGGPGFGVESKGLIETANYSVRRPAKGGTFVVVVN